MAHYGGIGMRMSHVRGAVGAGGGDWWLYSGQHTVSVVEVDGVSRTLVTLKKTGVLTVCGEVRADVWMCGCGAEGGSGVAGVKAGDGGAGARYVAAQGVKLGTGAVTVAASVAGPTRFAGLVADSALAKHGGSGGGAGAMLGGVVAGGTGDGVMGTVPFGLEGFFGLHCVGGSGGGFDGGGTTWTGTGGVGGRDGADGGDSVAGTEKPLGGAGPIAGGEGFSGAVVAAANGQSAPPDSYGCGGGGAGSGVSAAGTAVGGLGSAGVVYLLLA